MAAAPTFSSAEEKNEKILTSDTRLNYKSHEVYIDDI